MRTRILARSRGEEARWAFRAFRQSFVDNVVLAAGTGWRFSPRAPPHLSGETLRDDHSRFDYGRCRFSSRTPRRRSRDQDAAAELPTVAPCIVTLRFISRAWSIVNVIASFYRDSARWLRKSTRNTRRVGQVDTDEPDLPTAFAKVPFAPWNCTLPTMLMTVYRELIISRLKRSSPVSPVCPARRF